MPNTQSLMFMVKRSEPKLVTPAKPTPHEFKPLSDMDNLDLFRVPVHLILVYSHNPSMNGVDPVKVIREAISQTLVFYYPLAGRLRESSTGKLVVECTGEGVLFMEADADVTLDQFGYPVLPPFPCFDQLIFDAPGSGSSELLNSPLYRIQVTRLKCGGFIFCMHCTHTMTDAFGMGQFMSAVGEMARGATSPSVLPTWERHLLYINNQPQVEHNDVTNTCNDPIPPEHDLCYRPFFFGPTEISSLRKLLPRDFRHCSSFEIVTATVWKCRVVALEPHPTQVVSMNWPVNMRTKLKHLIPTGYYGNAILFLTSKSTAKELTENPLSYALQLIRNSYVKATEDNFRSPTYIKIGIWSYLVSDLRYSRFEEVDFGWGEPVYGGFPYYAPTFGFYVPFKNKNGESGIMVPICLATQAMERFEKELHKMFKHGDGNAIKSRL